MKSQSLVSNKLYEVTTPWCYTYTVHTSVALNEKQDLSSTPSDYEPGVLITPLRLPWMLGLRFYVLFKTRAVNALISFKNVPGVFHR